MSNAEIADRLASLAQLLRAQKENPYKVKAYQRAAAKIRTLSESIDELVRDDADLTAYAGIGETISGAIQEIVRTGILAKLEKLRDAASPELTDISRHPRLDPERVFRIYKKLGIASVNELREKLASGDIEKTLGRRMAEHVRQGLTETHTMLLYRADDLRVAIEEFLLNQCGVRRAEVVGEYRRRVEIIAEIGFVIETDDFQRVISKLERYGGRTMVVNSVKDNAVFALSSGILLQVQVAGKHDWGLALIACTGSKAHLRKLTAVTGPMKMLRLNGSFPTETALYRKFGLSFIQPELRGDHDEVERARKNTLPVLVSLKDIRGELHAHSTSSDGANRSVNQHFEIVEKALSITEFKGGDNSRSGGSVDCLFLVAQADPVTVHSMQSAIQILERAENERIKIRNSDFLAGLLTFQQRSEFFRFAIGKNDRVVLGIGAAVVGPYPRCTVPAQGSRFAFYLNKKKAAWG